MSNEQKCPKCGSTVLGPFAHQTPDGKWHKRIVCLDAKGCGWHKDIGGGKTAFEVNPVIYSDK